MIYLNTKYINKSHKFVMKANHFNIGFAASQLIHDLKRRDSVSSSDILNFRRNIYKFVQVTVNKIFERFPVV